MAFTAAGSGPAFCCTTTIEFYCKGETELNSKYNKKKWSFIAKEQGERVMDRKLLRGRVSFCSIDLVGFLLNAVEVNVF